MRSDGISLVTGAAGFLGGHLIEQLVSRGGRIRATAPAWEDADDLRMRHEAGEIEFVRADLRKPETLPPLFAGRVESVFHLGAICNFSSPDSVLQPVNVAGVARITERALSAGVRCFIYMGSTSVYGPCRGRSLDEDAPREPSDAYGRSKRDGEDVVWRAIRSGLPAVILRPCTIYGPGHTDGAGKVFSRRSSLAAIPGDGRQRLSNVRVEDVAGAAIHLSQREQARGQAFNVADDSHPTLEEALVLAADAFGGRRPRVHLPLSLLALIARVDGVLARLRGRIPDLEYDALRYLHADYVVDNRKLKQAGYRLIHPDFAESMRELGRRDPLQRRSV